MNEMDGPFTFAEEIITPDIASAMMCCPQGCYFESDYDESTALIAQMNAGQFVPTHLDLIALNPNGKAFDGRTVLEAIIGSCTTQKLMVARYKSHEYVAKVIPILNGKPQPSRLQEQTIV